ncbi:class I SAM-dependent RNA methyltransferase [Sphingomonas morindae]|uniref:Class I SAM-dependent RNA methyltransferase n=1 Tax=Sphingomonas morindae TaxID=1541170 RepID=A0ABY4X4R6_9SPHN|nr:class I SAM-dependent RNA methyltransferase [Sphingomonas morindae]USI71883.1 class I SAM-dependent RNA methyltransferase [Sphingomonas morindae]
MQRITRLAAQGDGLTEQGSAVPLAAPGDTIDAAGEVRPGPHRAVPPCRHFPQCGGCQLQHVDDGAYADFLVDRVIAALHAQQIDTPAIRAPYLSPPRTRRRAALRAERQGRGVRLGFNEQASRQIVDLAECWILAPPLWALVAPLRTLLATLLPARSVGEVQMTLTDQGVDLRLAGVAAEGLAEAEALTRFAETHRLARIAVDAGHGAETRWEPQPVTVTLGGTAVGFPSGGFLQATADGEAALVAAVREGVGAARTVADLFAGLGTFALALPGRVLAAEGARDALLALKAAGAGRIVADHRDLFRRPYAPAELARFDAVVLDPPRAGAREQVARLAEAPGPRVVYVSCNPATFARDARMLLAGGRRLAWVQPVGQFRWSTHVELVGVFDSPAATPG